MKTAIAVIGLFIAVLAFVVVLGCTGQKPAGNITTSLPGAECTADSDCVPGGCCHPSTCVPKSQAPDCKGIFCTMVCSGPLDCGAGSCACNNGKCAVVSSSTV